MPSDKEIEWAIEETFVKHNYVGEILRDAYLSMKSERDKYKAIVEMDTKALNQVREAVANSEYWWMDCPDRGGIDCELVDKALALRENKEE